MSDSEITADASSRLRRGSVVAPLDANGPPKRQRRELPKWRLWLKEINVEPAIFLFAITLGTMQSNGPLFVYWARCNQLFDESGLPSPSVHEVCAHLGDKNYTDYQNTVEKDITTTKIFLQIANGIPTLVFAPLIGTWSDRYGGRKIPHLISLVSLATYATIYMVASLTINSVNIYALLFTAETLEGVLGGYPILFSSALSMLADEARRNDDMKGSSISLKICVSSALQFIGQLLGTFITSLCSASTDQLAAGHSSGYTIAFGCAAGICWFTLLYSAVMVKETHTLDRRRIDEEESTPRGALVSLKKLKDFLVGLVAILVKKREGWARFALNITIIFNVIEFLAMDNSLLLLLVKKSPFEWSDTLFSHYQLLKTCSISLGMLLAPIFLSRAHFLLGKDSILIMMGATSTATSFAIDAFSKRTEYLFITGGLAFFTGGLTPGFRSFLPKLVEKNETARLYALFSIVMTIWPIIATTVLNSIYNASLSSWPGMAFMVASAYDFFVLFGQLGLHLLMYPAWKRERQQEHHLQQE
ncbi:hypothetical protein QR680_015167 [Steinernema hermaphroditum]|uniref:Major facilitator superfamily (MFS) profile domain-containing protein n=1 Tax=Steinernema hermaphroditum TaxID=289476 RepID=A0AA39IE01_9BILA|nr:hypothetical protein QR680_015167 [Steinernema hermaphroditum]